MLELLTEKLWLTLLIALALGFLFPKVGLFFLPLGIYLLMVIMFLTCLGISFNDLSHAFRNGRGILIAFLYSFLIIPFMAYLFGFTLSPEYALGLILLSAMPVGMSTTLMAEILKGDKAFTLAATILITLASPILSPFIVYLFAGKYISVGMSDLFLSMFRLIVIPFGLAYLFRPFLREYTKYTTPISGLLLSLVIFGIAASAVPYFSAEIIFPFIIISLFTVVSYGVGYFFTFGRNKKEKITYMLLSSYKNTTLAMVIALELFGPIVSIPAILRVVVSDVLIAFLIFKLRK